MSAPRFRYLFGPVLSRRMGRSLGIDLLPFKTCSFNCVFCQLGRTPSGTVERREFVPTADVLAELDAWIADDGQADYVTLAGSGEPTLHTGFGRILDRVRERTAIRSALLTNSSLLHLPEVRADAVRADVVKVSLSAWDGASFARVNRPHAGVAFERMVDGMRSLRADFRGELWLEVFLLAGINDRPEDVRRIASIVSTIRPDHVHLNSVARMPAESDARPVEPERLAGLARLFAPEAEVVADAAALRAVAARRAAPAADVDEVILGLVRRHPCTAAEVARALGLDAPDAGRRLEALTTAGRARRETVGGAAHYAGTPEPAAGVSADPGAG